MQGVWYLSDESGELSTEHHLDFYVITIKDDKISITPDPAVGLVASPPRMYDIMWAEDEVKGMNGKMHSFFPRYDGIELMNWTPYIPFEIKNTILKLGSTSGSEGTIYYYKYMCTKK